MVVVLANLALRRKICITRLSDPETNQQATNFSDKF